MPPTLGHAKIHGTVNGIFNRDEATLYERVSVGWLVGPLVRPSVTLSSNSVKNGFLPILNDVYRF